MQRQDFLEQKSHASSDKSAPVAKINMDITNKKSMESTSKITFKCDQCNFQFENEKGRMYHQGKKHKLTDSPIPQVDGHSD